MSAPSFGCAQIFWNASDVSGPVLERMCSDTARLQMSWSSAACLSPWISLSVIRRPRASAGADVIARRAPQEVLVPHLYERLLHRQRDRGRDGEGVENEIRGRGAEERLGDFDAVDHARLAARQVVDEARGLHRHDQARHAE